MLIQLTQPENGIEVLSYPVSALVIRVNQPKPAGGSTHSDDVLAVVVASVRKALRSADLLFRSGEQELVALLLKADRHSSSVIAGRLQDAVQRVASENASGRPVEISVVVSALHHDASSIDRFLKESAAQTQPSGQPILPITVPGASQSVH